MKIKASTLNRKISHFYYPDINSYDPDTDPELTYQEHVLITYAHYFHFDDIVDLDEIDPFEDHYVKTWLYYPVGFFFNPMIVDKPWDQVLVDRAHKDNHLETKIYSSDNDMREKSPFKEIIQMKWDYRKKKADEREKQKIINRDKQREYRARKKLEKEAKNK